MKRRHFIGTLATGTGVLVTGFGQKPVTTVKPTLVRTPLVLMVPRADGLVAVWAVNQLSRGRIEWETADGEKGLVGADAFGFVPQGEHILRVRLSGLKPVSPTEFTLTPLRRTIRKKWSAPGNHFAPSTPPRRKRVSLCGTILTFTMRASSARCAR